MVRVSSVFNCFHPGAGEGCQDHDLQEDRGHVCFIIHLIIIPWNSIYNLSPRLFVPLLGNVFAYLKVHAQDEDK